MYESTSLHTCEVLAAVFYYDSVVCNRRFSPLDSWVLQSFYKRCSALLRMRISGIPFELAFCWAKNENSEIRSVKKVDHMVKNYFNFAIVFHAQKKAWVSG